jgi:hypothetical protein
MGPPLAPGGLILKSSVPLWKTAIKRAPALEGGGTNRARVVAERGSLPMHVVIDSPPPAAAVCALWNAAGFGANAPEDLEGRLFPAGVYPVAAYDRAGALVGLARVFSDGIICGWIADLAVSPGEYEADIRTALIEACVARFGHLDLYSDAFAHEVEAFRGCGLSVQPRLTAVSRRGR